MARPRPSIEDILESRLSLSGECWEWTGSVNKVLGYGQYRTRETNHFAHRLAYETLVEKLEPYDVLHHVCENKLCFNPDHLEVTSKEDHQRLHASEACVRCGGSRWSIVKPHNWRRCMDCHARRERQRRLTRMAKR